MEANEEGDVMQQGVLAKVNHIRATGFPSLRQLIFLEKGNSANLTYFDFDSTYEIC